MAYRVAEEKQGHAFLDTTLSSLRTKLTSSGNPISVSNLELCKAQKQLLDANILEVNRCLRVYALTFNRRYDTGAETFVQYSRSYRNIWHVLGDCTCL